MVRPRGLGGGSGRAERRSGGEACRAAPLVWATCDLAWPERIRPAAGGGIAAGAAEHLGHGAGLFPGVGGGGDGVGAVDPDGGVVAAAADRAGVSTADGVDRRAAGGGVCALPAGDDRAVAFAGAVVSRWGFVAHVFPVRAVAAGDGLPAAARGGGGGDDGGAGGGGR